MVGGLPGRGAVCLPAMNVVRSPMASGLMKHFYGRQLFVCSAGVRAGEPDGFAIAVMDELGIDISPHKPIVMEDLHDTSFDMVFSLTPEAHHKALELTRTMAVECDLLADIRPLARQRQPGADPRRLPHGARSAFQAHPRHVRRRRRAGSLDDVSRK